MDNEHRYYSMIPHIIDDSDLSPYAYRLYGHIRRVVGEVDGICWQSTDTMAQSCRMSKGMISKAKQELVIAGFITIEERVGNAGRAAHVIRVVDVWAENVSKYDQSSPHELQSSPHELKKNPSKKNPKIAPEEIVSSHAETAQEEGETDMRLSEDTRLPEDDRKFWAEKERERDELIAKMKNTPPEDMSHVQHFGGEEIRRVIAKFADLWPMPIPTSKRVDLGAVKDWSKGANQIIEICGDNDPVRVMESYKHWYDEEERKNGAFLVTRPGSITNTLRAFMGKYKPPKTVKVELDENGIPIFYG